MFDNGQTLSAAVSRDRSALAIVDGDRQLTYGDLKSAALRLAAGLEALGIGRGDRLLVAMQNRAEMVLAYWATQLAGIVFTPVNWRAKSSEIGYYTADSGARAILYEQVTEAAVRDCPEASALIRIAVDGADASAVSFAQLLTSDPVFDGQRAAESDISVLLYTSGTTGPGKGVPRRHRAERAAALAHVAQNAYLSGEITLGVMPLYHTMGVRSLLAMALANGTFICQHRFDAGASLALIERHGVTALYLVPTLYHDLLAHPRFPSSAIASVRKLGFAGAPMSDGLLRRVEAAFAPELFVNHYGSSEIYTFTINQRAAAKPGSAGKAGLNSEIRVIAIGAAGVEPVAPGQEGQIIASLASEEAFEGYWRRPEADARSIRDGWYLTGDLGRFDHDGDLFVTGRVDDMMISGGENILPSEIEAILSRHPGVDAVAVVGMPHERLGQAVTAFVVRSVAVTEAELDQWCKSSELADFKRPRTYRFVTELPMSPVGKLLRRRLVEEHKTLQPADERVG